MTQPYDYTSNIDSTTAAAGVDQYQHPYKQEQQRQQQQQDQGQYSQYGRYRSEAQQHPLYPQHSQQLPQGQQQYPQAQTLPHAYVYPPPQSPPSGNTAPPTSPPAGPSASYQASGLKSAPTSPPGMSRQPLLPKSPSGQSPIQTQTQAQAQGRGAVRGAEDYTYAYSAPDGGAASNYGTDASTGPVVNTAPAGQAIASSPDGSRAGTQSSSTPLAGPASGVSPPSKSFNTTPHANAPHHSIMHETEAELTADELEQYNAGLLTWDKAKNWRFWLRKEWTWYYVLFVVIIVVVALMAFFHHSIINWLSPFVRKLQSIHYGWLIPVAILFVLSFPPLFGNEIVMVLVGIVWGLGVGFAITAVGIMLGEAANYFVFRYACRARAHRLTKKSLNYACLTEVVKSGGFWMCFLIRLSAIPTHISTVLFAVCELPYLLALIAGLPKQLIAVYVGVVLAGSSGDSSTSVNSHVISDTVFGVTAVITLGAMWYIYRQMTRVRKRVLIGMRADLRERGMDVGGEGEGVLGASGVRK